MTQATTFSISADKAGESLILMSDGPPTHRHPAGIIPVKLLDALETKVAAVFSRQYRRAISPLDIQNAVRDVPLYLYPDSTNFIPRRYTPIISSIADAVLFWVSVQKLKRIAHRVGANRVFAICGGDPWFFLNIWGLICSGFQVDVYLLDDLHESAKRSQSKLTQLVARTAVLPTLRKCTNVFAISTGFCEHLSRFDVSSQWLPLPDGSVAPEFTPYVRSTPDIRPIAFIGSVNFLYDESLRDFYNQILTWNSQSENFKVILQLWLLGDPSRFVASLPSQEYLKLCEPKSENEIVEALKSCWACLLPYNFDASVRTMVQTSFSSKLLAYLGAGRPIVAFGPEDTSISRYFSTNGFPLSFSDQSSLSRVFAEISKFDGPDLISKYKAAWHRFHSRPAIRKILFPETLDSKFP